MGLFGPTGVPAPVVERLRADVRRVMNAPDLRERLGTASSLDTYNVSVEEFVAAIRADYDKYGKVIKQFGIKAD